MAHLSLSRSCLFLFCVLFYEDNYIFAKLTVFIKNKADLTADKLPQLEEICGDSIKAQQVLDASRMSMGTDISPIDMINIESFATRVVSLTEYRKKLHNYLLEKMNLCAPNLSALIGEQVGARLISHAGSLTNLAKYPASTVQILGAEKALFRALKTKGQLQHRQGAEHGEESGSKSGSFAMALTFLFHSLLFCSQETPPSTV